jgi:hypothetical protein
VNIRVDFVIFDCVSHRLSWAQRNGERDLVIFLDFLGNLNLGFNVVVQSPADLAEIRNVGHRLDVITAPKQEMVADQQTLVLLKRFSHNPDVEKARVEFERAQKTEERFHKPVRSPSTCLGSPSGGSSRNSIGSTITCMPLQP